MIEILDPIGFVDQSSAPTSGLARRLKTLDGETMCLFSNGKPNAANFLRAIERELQTKFSIGGRLWIDKYEYGMLTIGAPEWMLDRIAEAGFVIHASGD
jgi:hypothetical protein